MLPGIKCFAHEDHGRSRNDSSEVRTCRGHQLGVLTTSSTTYTKSQVLSLLDFSFDFFDFDSSFDFDFLLFIYRVC